MGPPPVPPSASNIKHLVVVVQENHSFDAYFANYCTAMAGSNPTCNAGPACCETPPPKDPGTGDSPVVLDDAENAGYDPSHLSTCELQEMDNGKMDMYVTAGDGGMCGSPKNYAFADAMTMAVYWNLAKANALADHYFQPIAGQSSSNDMYFARAHHVFTDNAFEPPAIGSKCAFSPTAGFTDQTIADLLIGQNVSYAWFAEGYQAMVDAQANGKCPTAPSDCMFKLPTYPCVFDPGDVPFEYYATTRDNPKYMLDYADFAKDIAATALPAVTFVKALGYKSEHPGVADTITAGTTFVSGVVDAVAQSPYATDTLVLITFDESGGFYDHIPPPPTSTVDMQPYGPRVPLFAVGAFARKNFISHVEMEHSSIVKFIEWNWLGQKTGQLAGRDAAVANLGDLLDPATTGVAVPSQ
jgi:phospholipase C